MIMKPDANLLCPVCGRNDFRTPNGLRNHVERAPGPEHMAHRASNGIVEANNLAKDVSTDEEKRAWPCNRTKDVTAAAADMSELGSACLGMSEQPCFAGKQFLRDIDIAAAASGLRSVAEQDLPPEVEGNHAADAFNTATTPPSPEAPTNIHQAENGRTYPNSGLINLDDPGQGQVVLNKLCEYLAKGTPIATATARLRIDVIALERIRRSTTSWGRHVNNSVNMAEAEFEHLLVHDLLKAKDNNSIKKAETYIAAFKPRFAAQHKLRIDYELNAMLDLVKRHVTQDQWLAICDEAVNIDAKMLLNELDAHLLPKIGQ